MVGGVILQVLLDGYSVKRKIERVLAEVYVRRLSALGDIRSFKLAVDMVGMKEAGGVWCG